MESLQKYVIDHHQKTIAECSNEELYIALLNYTKQASAQKKINTGKKKVYYISAEFLVFTTMLKKNCQMLVKT